MAEPDPIQPKRKKKPLSAPKIATIVSGITGVLALIPPLISVAKNPEPLTINNTTNNNIFVLFVERWKDGSEILRGGSSSKPEATEAQRQGPFELIFEPVEIAQSPFASSGSILRAAAGIRIKNMEAKDIRIAFVEPSPSLQTDGGYRFSLEGENITGVERRLAHWERPCTDPKQQMTLLAPNETVTASMVFSTKVDGREIRRISSARLSGNILVQRDGETDCSKRSISGSSIPARLSR
jgi:hypothetical protein